MKNPFSGLFRARDKPQDSVSAAPVFYFGTSGSGKSVTVQSAIQLSTVYACVRVISETVASLPLGVYEAKTEGKEKVQDLNSRNPDTNTYTKSIASEVASWPSGAVFFWAHEWLLMLTLLSVGKRIDR